MVSATMATWIRWLTFIALIALRLFARIGILRLIVAWIALPFAFPFVTLAFVLLIARIERCVPKFHWYNATSSILCLLLSK